MRGCVAIERGPLVYCLEQADHPGGGLDDIVLDTAAPARWPSTGPTCSAASPRSWPKAPAAAGPHGRLVALHPGGRRPDRRRRPRGAHRGPLLRLGQPRGRRHARLDPHRLIRLTAGATATTSQRHIARPAEKAGTTIEPPAANPPAAGPPTMRSPNMIRQRSLRTAISVVAAAGVLLPLAACSGGGDTGRSAALAAPTPSGTRTRSSTTARPG